MIIVYHLFFKDISTGFGGFYHLNAFGETPALTALLCYPVLSSPRFTPTQTIRRYLRFPGDDSVIVTDLQLLAHRCYDFSVAPDHHEYCLRQRRLLRPRVGHIEVGVGHRGIGCRQGEQAGVQDKSSGQKAVGEQV